MLASDLDNPLGLDYAGLNFVETLQRDAQANQNKREYLNLKRVIAKHTLHTTLSEKLRVDNRRNKFAVPAFYDVARDDLDESSAVADEHGAVRVVRTMQKPSNANKWNEESTRREDAITKLICQEIEAEQTVPKNDSTNEFSEFDFMCDDLNNINDSLSLMPSGVKQPPAPQNRTRPDRIYPQNLTEFERNRKRLSKKSRAFNQKIKIAADHFGDTVDDAVLRMIEKTILEENDSMVTPASSCCAVGEIDRDDFGLDVGLDSDDHRFRLEGFRNPIRTNLQPKSFEDEQNMKSGCITRNEWLAEILPQRIRKIQRSRSIDRIDASINHDSKLKENNQKKSVGDTMFAFENENGRATIGKPRRKEITSYFGGDGYIESAQCDRIDVEIQLPRVRSFAEDGLLTNNLNEPKNEITKKFKIRRHRLHRDATEHKEAKVIYQSKTWTENTERIDGLGAMDAAENVSLDEESCDSADDVGREAHVTELIGRQNSINACDSSEPSSMCSNYSQCSGSEIYFDDVAIPLRHLTKSYDPYEVANRAAVKAIRLQDRKESEEAYYKVPYPGQLQDMRKLMGQKVGKKVRPTRTPSKRGNATESDIMNKYIYFPKKTNVTKLVDVLREMSRLNFMASVYDDNEKKLPQLRQALAEAEVALAKKIRDCGVRDSQLLNQLAEAKRQSNLLEKKLNAFQRECGRVKLRILEDEQCMRARTAYQKLNYLLMDKQWRQKYDWLHTKANGSLESVEKSIRNRYKSHMRTKPTNDAFDVKSFYEKRYPLSSREKNRKTLKDAKSFLQAMHVLEVSPIVWTLNSICQLHRRIALNTCTECLNDVITNVFSQAESIDPV